MNESEFIALAQVQFVQHGLDLDGWTFEITDLPKEGMHGHCDFDAKLIRFQRSDLPCLDRNGHELVRHEIAHALVGHGEHNLEWWDKLIDIGGRGIWVEYGDKIRRIGVVVSY